MILKPSKQLCILLGYYIPRLFTKNNKKQPITALVAVIGCLRKLTNPLEKF